MLSSPCQPAVNSGAARFLCYREMQLCRVDLSQSTTSHHLKGATRVNASLLLRDHLIKRWKKNIHSHLIVKTEYIKIRGHPSPGQIKAYLLVLDEICWQLLNGWLQRIKQAKKNMQDQQAFSTAELALFGVEVNNPKDKKTAPFSYQIEIRAVIIRHAWTQIITDNINPIYNNLCFSILFTCNLLHIMLIHSKTWQFLSVNIGHPGPPWLDVIRWQTLVATNATQIGSFWEAVTILVLQLVLCLFKVWMALWFANADLDTSREQEYNTVVI